MAASHSDRAVVIRLTDYSETSQIVSFFTQRHGQTRLIAKGIKRGTKKRFKTGMDLLELGEVAFAPARGDAELGTQTSWHQIDMFDGLRRQLPRLYAGLYLAELLGTLTEQGDPHEGQPGSPASPSTRPCRARREPATAKRRGRIQLRLPPGA